MFLHNILISLGWEKKETAAPHHSPGVVGGRGQVGVCGPPQLTFFRLPSGTEAAFPLLPRQCKGQITKWGWAGSELCSVFPQRLQHS